MADDGDVTGKSSCPKEDGGYPTFMRLAIRAIYEGGSFRPLDPLDLAEHTVVRIAVETTPEDAERKEWLEQGERNLTRVWDSEQDEVYNELLA